ncbi:MAG: DUF882 domain-containing protein [Proteobacteria bacterium]|nr:MAG: DUF882 domain-containing protein [Pseudomonadota bacterium]
MKHSRLILALALMLLPGLAHAADRFRLSGNCTGEGAKYVKGGRAGSPDIKPALNAIAEAAGKPLEVYSCFRSQDRQNKLLKARGCIPFGTNNCSATVAQKSQHTLAVAADFKNFNPDLVKQCQAIARGRSKTGGKGGVGTYPRGDGHFDVGSTRSWNRCKGVVPSSAGYKSGTVSNFRGRPVTSAGSKCYPTKRFPSCCGPVRERKGLCRQ